MKALITRKQKDIIGTALEKGGISPEEAREIYNSQSSIYETLNLLKESGFLKKKNAPTTRSEKFIYAPTLQAIFFYPILERLETAQSR